MFAARTLGGLAGIGSLLALAACEPGVTEPLATPGAEAPALSTTTTATPIFRDGFDTGARAAAQGGYRWTAAQAKSGDAVTVSREKARSGSYSLKFLFGADRTCDDSWAEQRFQLGEDLREVWIEYYIYFPNGTEGLGAKYHHRQPMKKTSTGTCSTTPDVDTNNKFLALWDLDYRDKDVMVVYETRRSTAAAEGDSNLNGLWGTDTRAAGNYNQPGGRWNAAITDQLRGRWVQVRAYSRVADSKSIANGVVRLWADGVLRIDMQNLDLAPTAGGNRFFRNGYILGWSNAGFNRNTAVYVDDVKIYRSSPGW
ncbi:MAG TPA: hypothetical protein VHG51_13755 [Longimicrobiaceae bacterium]|nr:hypothetical protein [Longimicrobiaceae bacterium]